MTSNDSPFSSIGKENDSLSAMFGSSPSKMTPQRAEKVQASEARAKVLKERAQEAQRSSDGSKGSTLFVTEEHIRLSVEKDIRRSRDGGKSPEKRAETRRLSASSSPHKKYDTTNETSWSQFLKWVPLNQTAPAGGTILDNEGYAVPNTRGHYREENLRTPERIKSPEDMFFTPAGNFYGRESSPYVNRNSSGANDTLIKHLQEDFQRKLSLESTKIDLMARKTIQGLEEVEKLIVNEEKPWKSPLKKCTLRMPEFSGVRQSHPLTKEHAEFRSSLPGAAVNFSEDEATLDDVSPLNSEADPISKKAGKMPPETSKLSKILGSQLQAEINYTETSNRLSEKLDEVEGFLNTSKQPALKEGDISNILEGIELFDHSLPHYSLTPKQRYQKRITESSVPTPSRSTNKLKSVSFRGVERRHAYQDYCKSLEELFEFLKRHIEQQKKVHELIKEPSIYDEFYHRVVENYYADVKTQTMGKKIDAKQKSEDKRIYDEEFLAWIQVEKRFVENQTKFFAIIFTDLGKFIQKYDVPPPQPSYLPPRPEIRVRESSEEIASPAKSTTFKVTVDIKSPLKNAPPSGESYSKPQENMSTPQKIKEEARQPEKPDKNIWEISVREPETPSALDEAFVGGEPTPLKEADIFNQSMKDLPSGVFSTSERSSLSDPFVDEEQEEMAVEREKEPVDEEKPVEIAIEREPESVEEHSSNLSSPTVEEILPVAENYEEPVTKPKVPEIVPKLVGLSSEESSSTENKEESSSTDTEVPSSTNTRTPRSPRHPAVPPLELSLLHSSGRISIDASALFDDEEEIDDFLNRSGRKEPPTRYKLSDSLLLDSTSAEGEHVAKYSPQKEFVNEPYPKSPQPSPLPSASPLDLHKNQLQFNLSDLNLTEEEGLEDVKKPEPVLDFTISTEVNEYENRLATEEGKWEHFVDSLQDPRQRNPMMNKCIEIAWKVKEEHDHIPREMVDNWKTFVQKYTAPEYFEDPARQEMYNSEWIGMLSDVFEIAGDIYPREQSTSHKSLYYPLPSLNLDKAKFTEICRENLIEKRRTTVVVDTTKEYVWDLDPARRNAHEMICEAHNVFLRDEFYNAIEDEIKRGICQTSDLYLQKTVESVLKDGQPRV